MFSKMTTQCIVLVMAMFGVQQWAYCGEAALFEAAKEKVGLAKPAPVVTVEAPKPGPREMVETALIAAIAKGDHAAAANWAATRRDLVLVDCYGPVAELIRVNKPIIEAAIQCTPALLAECSKYAANDAAKNVKDPTQKELAMLWSDILAGKVKPVDVPVWFERLQKADAERDAQRVREQAERLRAK
jgi:hypothetical protein